MISISNDKFKALGGAYDITYIQPYYFKDLKFKALGTCYNISVQEIDKYHDLIDYGGKIQ